MDQPQGLTPFPSPYILPLSCQLSEQAQESHRQRERLALEMETLGSDALKKEAEIIIRKIEQLAENAMEQAILPKLSPPTMLGQPGIGNQDQLIANASLSIHPSTQ